MTQVWSEDTNTPFSDGVSVSNQQTLQTKLQQSKQTITTYHYGYNWSSQF